MISNNHLLLSQKLNITHLKNRVGNFVTKPDVLRTNGLMQAKLKQSQDNLFNFIKDNFI